MTQPNELSILDYASQPGEDVIASAGQRVQALLSAATQVAQSLQAGLAERARRVQSEREAERRQFKDRQDAEYEADKLVWRRVFDDRFWKAATPDSIARAWRACVPWAMGGFPSARAAVEHMRAEIQSRYGVEIDPVTTRSQDLLTLLAPEAATDAPVKESADQAPEEETPGTLDSISYRIRDLSGGDQPVEATGVVHLASDEGATVARLAAAERLSEHRQQHGGEDEPERFVIEVFAGTEVGGPPLFTLEEHEARAAQEWGHTTAEHTRSDDVAAIADGTDPGYIAEALRWARRQARDELAGADTPDRIEDLRGRLGTLALRLQAVEADARGEDGAVVFQWAQLRGELTADHWEQATPAETARVWDQVADWDPGRIRDQAQNHLRHAIQRRFDVPLPENATGAQILEALTVVADQTAMQAEAPRIASENAEQEWQRAQDAAGAQSEVAAKAYERLAAKGHGEAAAAAESVGSAFPAPPSARLRKSAAAAGDTPRSGDGPAPARARTGPQVER